MATKSTRRHENRGTYTSLRLRAVRSFLSVESTFELARYFILFVRFRAFRGDP